MEYYLLLTTVTAIIAALAWVVFRRSGDLGTLIGTAALYYWSLYGAWYIVIDKNGGASGKNYGYLETKMFPIELDGTYLWTIALYAGFILLIQFTLLLLLPRSHEPPLARLRIRHEPILVLALVAGVASIFLVRSELATAWTLHTSAYLYTRRNPSEWFTLHQVLNRVALVPAAIGFATFTVGERNRYFVNVRPRYTALGYAVVLGGMSAFTFMLGNKNEVLTALLAGVLTYAGSLDRIRWVRVGLVLGVGVWFLFSIDYFRSFAVSDLASAVRTESSAENVGEVAHFVTSSNESYAAHFSMYGVLTREVEPKFGYSFYSLACSVIPRIFWKNRPDDIYIYYSRSVGTMEGQGYSLHHATGWYLNFGYPGIALGAVVLGLAWAYAIQARRRIHARTGVMFRVFAVVAPWLFAACLPPLLRAGPEAYKGLIIDGVLIPVGVLMVGCRPRRKRPTPAALVWPGALPGEAS